MKNGKVRKSEANEGNSPISANNSSEYAPAQKKVYKKPLSREQRVAIMGRPKVYADNDPSWQAIIDAITGGLSLSSAIKAEGMPTWSTVQVKIRTDEKFREQYEKAIQDRADRLADEILDLADETMPPDLQGPGASAWVQQKRLQVDARKWVASKLKPRTYGDRLDVSVTDNRISVIGALEQAQKRVALGMQKDDNVIDVDVKQKAEHVEVDTSLASRMKSRIAE